MILIINLNTVEISLILAKIFKKKYCAIYLCLVLTSYSLIKLSFFIERQG